MHILTVIAKSETTNNQQETPYTHLSLKEIGNSDHRHKNKLINLGWSTILVLIL